MTTNPYPSRPYPVGVLKYPLPNGDDTNENIEAIRPYCLLEHGEPELLYSIPHILKQGGDYLNLGHGAGGSAMLLAQGLIDADLRGRVHSIDHFKMKTEDRVWGFQEAQKVIDDFNLSSMITLWKGYTSDFVDVQNPANTFGFYDLTFLFIDADHSYDGVRHDFVYYGSRVKKGGAVAFHDTNQEPSHRVISEYIEGYAHWQLIEHVNRIKVFQRV